MSDDTDRRMLRDIIEAECAERAVLEERHGQVWNTEELQRDYEVRYFLAPFVIVIRRRDGVPGTLMFQHMPRYYFAWQG